MTLFRLNIRLLFGRWALSGRASKKQVVATLFDRLRDEILYRKNQCSESTTTNRLTAVNSFEHFFQETGNIVRPVTLSALTSDHIRAYERWAIVKGHRPNYIRCNLRNLRALINYIQPGLGTTLFQGIHTSNTQTDRRSVSEQVIRSLAQMKSEENPKQEQARDIEWNGVKQRIRRLTDHWTRTPGDALNLTIYTNADEVELIMNGRSLGTKQNDRQNPKVRNQIRWDKLTYEPGYIEAVARTAGKVVARHRAETAGPAVALRLTPDREEWRADGLDLQHVVVEAVDKKGRVVPAADMDIHFTVEGGARLVAVSSGDHYSDELTQTDHRRLYEGRAQPQPLA